MPELLTLQWRYIYHDVPGVRAIRSLALIPVDKRTPEEIELRRFVEEHEWFFYNLRPSSKSLIDKTIRRDGTHREISTTRVRLLWNSLDRYRKAWRERGVEASTKAMNVDLKKAGLEPVTQPTSFLDVVLSEKGKRRGKSAK